jgi:hypothetical protein
MSIFVTCATRDEVDELFEELSTDGSVLMPLDDYGFSPPFRLVHGPSRRLVAGWMHVSRCGASRSSLLSRPHALRISNHTLS